MGVCQSGLDTAEAAIKDPEEFLENIKEGVNKRLNKKTDEEEDFEPGDN